MRALYLTVCLMGAILRLGMASMECSYVEDHSYSDLTCSGDNELVLANDGSKIKCSISCDNDPYCTGFVFRPSDGKCIGCRGGDESLSQSATGMKYFVGLGRRWGQSCSDDVNQCAGMNQMCLNGLCVCVAGYSFLEEAWTCQDGCVTYGNTFQTYVGYRITSNNVEQLQSVTFDSCINACIDRTWGCVSIDYSADYLDYPVCNLQRVSAIDLPQLYEAVELFLYLQRNC